MILLITGVEHRLLFTCCECEPVAITLTRANLWPATPSNPRYAFSFALLDWVEALLLECHVALRDFCNALKFQCPFFVPKVDVCMYFMFTLPYTEYIEEEEGGGKGETCMYDFSTVFTCREETCIPH